MKDTINVYVDSFLFTLVLLSLTILTYGVFSRIDYSSDFFSLVRGLSIAANFFFFLVLCRHNSFLERASDKLNQYPSVKQSGRTFIGFCLTIVHLLITVYITETLNDWLLTRNNKQTTATIKDCVKSKGSEYCVYAYTADNVYYEVRYHNDEPEYKFREYDSIQILYYPANPVISKIVTPRRSN